jgi:predicted metal-dependent HD superfamily phosphohydrolase
MNYGVLTQIVESHIVRLFEHHPNPARAFHNLTHTRTVVLRTREISAYYKLPEHELFIATTAAWFHDTGYLSGGQRGHERQGADMVQTFLTEHHVPDGLIDAIRGCILATRLPQCPSGLLEQIVCDADLYHFGTPELFIRDKTMRQEVEIVNGCVIDEAKWVAGTIRLLESHSYHTSYCRNTLNKQKQINLQILRAKLQVNS